MKINELLEQVEQSRQNFNGSIMQHEVENVLINGIFCQVGRYSCDLHHYLFNEGHTWIYTGDCERAAENFGVWDCIALVQAYEKSNFGEVNTDLSDCFKVANMAAYICGEWLLRQSETLADHNGALSKKDIYKISIELMEFVKYNPRWVLDCWAEYCN